MHTISTQVHTISTVLHTICTAMHTSSHYFHCITHYLHWLWHQRYPAMQNLQSTHYRTLQQIFEPHSTKMCVVEWRTLLHSVGVTHWRKVGTAQREGRGGGWYSTLYDIFFAKHSIKMCTLEKSGHCPKKGEGGGLSHSSLWALAIAKYLILS